MHICVGSGNNIKILAVQELIEDYPHLKNAAVTGISVPSDVSDQPMSLDETTLGASNRARATYQNDNVTYGIGIESGLMEVLGTKSGFMDVCACVIFDGTREHFGLSSAWEVPEEVIRLMIDEGLDMNQAAHKSGLTDNPNVGSAEGLIGIVTKGRLDRKSYTKEAVRTALIKLEP